MIELVRGDDVYAIASSRFRLSFVRDGDRWGSLHRRRDRCRLATRRRSIEGGDDPTRVVSPAYQEIQLRDDAGSRPAFLIGQSGPHHFSAVFTVRETPEAATVEVDLADRCREEVESLGCTYGVDRASGGPIVNDPEQLDWGLGTGRLVPGGPRADPPALDESWRASTRARVASPDRSVESHGSACLYRWRWSIGPRLTENGR